jgi:calcium-dependent protein kinase
MVYKRIQNA